MALCSKCGCCQAQQGFELCYWCEDGVPCPGQKNRVAQPAVNGGAAAKPSTLALKPASTSTALKTASNLSAAATPGTRSEEARPSAKAAVPRPADKSTARKTATQRPRRTGPLDDYAEAGARIAARFPAKTKKGKPMPRFCSCGCGTELKGRWPYIKGHNKPSTKSTTPARRAVVRPPSKPVAKQRNGADAVANICVPETALDRFWSGLSVEEKAEIFVRQLGAD